MNSEVGHILGVNSTRITINILLLFSSCMLVPRSLINPSLSSSKKGKTRSYSVKLVVGQLPKSRGEGRALSHLPKGKTRVVGGNLTIVGVAKSDSGAYECSAKNLLRQETAVAILMVIERLRFTISPPLKITAKKSSDLMLNCKAQGSTVIIWKRAGNLLPGNHVIHRNGSLLLRNFDSQDAGSYTCVAKNAQRSIQATSVVVLAVHIRKYTILSIRTSTKAM